MKTPTPKQVAAIRAGLGLSTEAFGRALGYTDASRVVRALELGERNGKPYRLTGTGLKALEYLLAIREVYRATRIPLLGEVLPPDLRQP